MSLLSVQIYLIYLDRAINFVFLIVRLGRLTFCLEHISNRRLVNTLYLITATTKEMD